MTLYGATVVGASTSYSERQDILLSRVKPKTLKWVVVASSVALHIIDIYNDTSALSCLKIKIH